MTVEEIFNSLSSHMLEGLMIHSQLSDYYGFLGLEGYQECHKYHYYEEDANYKKLIDYYLHHYDKLISNPSFVNPNIIPESWFGHSRFDVNMETRRSAIEAGMIKWIDWEIDTKRLYSQLYQELISLNEIAAAIELANYIKDVDYELADAMNKNLELKETNYDITVIIEEQKKEYKKYKKKIKEINLC